jgi:hypothetical protein
MPDNATPVLQFPLLLSPDAIPGLFIETHACDEIAIGEMSCTSTLIVGVGPQVVLPYLRIVRAPGIGDVSASRLPLDARSPNLKFKTFDTAAGGRATVRGEVGNLLYYHPSGLLRVSGPSGAVRVLSASDTPYACEADELFTYRVAGTRGF